MKKNIILVGGAVKTKALAYSLFEKGYSVTVINASLKECEKMAEKGGINVIHGDGTLPNILEEADVMTCDIVIALTPKDYDNLLICELCKKQFHVNKTVSILKDPRKTDFFYKMGVDSVVCAPNVISSIIEQQTFMDQVSTMIPIGAGNLNIMEVHIPKDASSCGKKLWELNLPKDVIIGCILRGDKSLIPRGESRILADDTLFIISLQKQNLLAIDILGGRK